MSISPVDNKLASLGGLSPTGDPGVAGLEPREVDRPLGADGAAAPLGSEPDAQSLLALEVWSSGPRFFDLSSTANGAGTAAATPDELDPIATDVLSFIT
jgi:hypothetical protein